MGFWNYCSTLDKNLDKSKRRRSYEFIRRISTRLFDELHEWSLKGLTAISEEFAPTVCYNVEWCTIHTLPKHFESEKLQWDARVTEEEFEEFKKTQPNKFFHALKF